MRGENPEGGTPVHFRRQATSDGSDGKRPTGKDLKGRQGGRRSHIKEAQRSKRRHTANGSRIGGAGQSSGVHRASKKERKRGGKKPGEKYELNIVSGTPLSVPVPKRQREALTSKGAGGGTGRNITAFRQTEDAGGGERVRKGNKLSKIQKKCLKDALEIKQLDQ